MIYILPQIVARQEIEFDLTPSTSLMTSTGIGSMNMGLGTALGEIIANSLDWELLSKAESRTIIEDAAQHEEGQKFLTAIESEYGSLSSITSEEPPQIEIEIDNILDEIRIIDKGVGMNRDELETALQLKRSSDKVRAPLRMRKGQFGMGLKVSTLGLGRSVEIHTRSIKTSGKTIIFRFSDKEMEGRASWTGIKGYVTDEMETDSPLGNRPHGTAIVISELTRKFSKDDSLDAREELCDIFHYALKILKAEIRIDGKLLVPTEPDMNSDVPLLKLDDFD
ncbi:MAG: ATP-binding protein, partial [bacterium]